MMLDPGAPAACRDKMLSLARPLSGLRRLRSYDPFISDLAALLTGVKPVIYLDHGRAGGAYIKELCRALRLVLDHPEEPGAGARNYHLRGKRRCLLIGRAKKAVAKAAAAWRKSVLGEEWGEALGYPSCCVKAYLAWKKESSAGGPDLIERTWRASPGLKRLDFRLNNVYNFFSRVTESPADRESYRLLNAVNPEVDLPTVNAISWHPCSYACGRSVRSAGTAFRFIERYLPDHAAFLRAHLSKPVLFLGKYRFLNFTGRVRNGVVHFSGICRPRSLLTPGEIMRAVNASEPAGGGLRLGIRKALSLYPGEKPFLLDFSG